MTCKKCGKKHTNGTNFCTKKCRQKWIKDHEIKDIGKRGLRGDFDLDVQDED